MKYSDNIIRIITYCVVAAIVLLFAARPNGILKPFGLFVRDILDGLVPNRAGYAFGTNSSKNLDYRHEDILDIDSGNGKYRNYIPQGFSMTTDYIYFSGYHKYETCDGCSWSTWEKMWGSGDGG